MDQRPGRHWRSTQTSSAEAVIVRRRRWTAAADRGIAAVVEPVVAALVIAEIVLLASGVFARYVMHQALVWSDELATILFLWLSMLGAVIAFQRGEHIRLTAVLRRLPRRAREIAELVSPLVVAVFVLELMPASLKFFVQEQIDLTPALSIPRSYVVLAILVGLALMLLVALLRLTDADPRVVGALVAVAAVLSAIVWSQRDAIAAWGNVDLVLFFVVLLGAFVLIGVPIAFSFGVATLSYLAIATNVPLSAVVGRMDEGIENLILLAIPLFIFLGYLMESTGIARRLVGALASLVGHIRGGLNVVLVAAMYLVSGISGSKIADMAAVAPVLFPDMERRGQRRPEMIALLATSGAMAETIPPSLVLIIIGSLTGVSIASLFTAGLLPAFISALFLLVVAQVNAHREQTAVAPRPPLAAIGRAVWVAVPGLVLPVLVRVFVVNGIATATEVSVVAILYALFVGVAIYREFDWRRLYPMLVDTASLAGVILLIIATATAMGWALTQSGFAQQLADVLGHAPGGPLGILLLSILIFAVLGSVLEGIPAMVLFAPLLFPVAKAAGINEVHYAIVAVLAMGMGLFSPPIGVGFFSACAIGKAEPESVVPAILPYLGALLASLLLIAFVPWISLGFLH